MAAAVKITNIRLAGDGNHGLLVTILGVGGVGGWSVSILRIARRSSGGNGQDNGDDELCGKIKLVSKRKLRIVSEEFNFYQLHVDCCFS